MAFFPGHSFPFSLCSFSRSEPLAPKTWGRTDGRGGRRQGRAAAQAPVPAAAASAVPVPPR